MSVSIAPRTSVACSPRRAQNAGGLEQANQQPVHEPAPYDVWTHTYDGMSQRMQRLRRRSGRGARSGHGCDLTTRVAAGLTGELALELALGGGRLDRGAGAAAWATAVKAISDAEGRAGDGGRDLRAPDRAWSRCCRRWCR